MKNLEERENQENQENIETQYKKSPERVVSQEDLQKEEVAEQEQLKSLLHGKDQALKPVMTEVQEENTNFTDITEILDVDSNVINYGQFICGKILGSTLLLTNVSEQDQIVTMNISKKDMFDCDAIFGQYNRDELPFQYKDGSQIRNSEQEFNCWFIENPVSKELQKQLTLKIGPQMSQEFIIVVKAPKNKL